MSNFKLVTNSAVNLGFPRGCINLKGEGVPTSYSAKFFSEKLHENEENSTEVRTKFVYVDLPLEFLKVALL